MRASERISAKASKTQAKVARHMVEVVRNNGYGGCEGSVGEGGQVRPTEHHHCEHLHLREGQVRC